MLRSASSFSLLSLLAVPTLGWALLQGLTSAGRAQDDLFVGEAPAVVPPEVERFLANIKRALEGGDTSAVLRLASTQDMSGAGWAMFRKQIPALSKDKPLKVKRIELLLGGGEEAAEFKVGNTLYKRTVPSTHVVSFALESAAGEISQFEIPCAKFAEGVNNAETWRLLPGAPQVPKDSTARLEEARRRTAASPEQTSGWTSLAYLCGMLGKREEAAAAIARLGELTKNKPQPYVETQIGWTYLHLGEKEKALAHFQRGFELAEAEGGRLWTSEYAYAVGLMVNGKPGEAVAHYDHAAGKGYFLSERKAMEDWSKNLAPAERELASRLFALWYQTTVPAEAIIQESSR